MSSLSSSIPVYFTGIAFIYHAHLNDSTGNLTWALNATLSSPLGHGEGFGLSVGISGNTAVVGSNSYLGPNKIVRTAFTSIQNRFKYSTRSSF